MILFLMQTICRGDMHVRTDTTVQQKIHLIKSSPDSIQPKKVPF